MEEVEKKQIHPKVFLYKIQNQTINNTLIYTFKVQVLTLKILQIECDFTGSTNIVIKEPDTPLFVCSAIVKPFEPPSVVARLELRPDWRLKTKFRLELKPPSKEDQTKWVDSLTTSLKAEINKIQALFQLTDVSLMKFQHVSSQLQHSFVKYLDIDFPPIQSSLVGKADNAKFEDDILTHWRRPVDYLSEPFAITYKIDPNIVQSGRLKHQAFYSVIRCLAHKPGLIQRLFQNISQVNPNSVYKLFLCNNGQWQSIIIDDFFPCQPVGSPKFISSSLNQIWPNLIEKAYAKTFDSYLSLKQLSVQDVFQDLTGYPTFIMPIQFSSEQIQAINIDIQKGCMVSLYTTQQNKQFEQDNFNSIANRAYFLQKINSRQLHVSTQKGIIKMTIPYAKTKFNMACVCQITHWQQIKIPGIFLKTQSFVDPDQFNFISRWYYSFDIKKETEISICLRQQDIHVGNNIRHKPYLSISLVLFKTSQNSQPFPVQISQFSQKRSIYIDTTLQPGSYMLVPITLSQIKSSIDLPQKQFVKDIFRKLDLIMTHQLKYAEIKTFCSHVKQPMDQQKYQNWLKKYTKLKGFGISAFRKLWNDNRLTWKPSLQQFSTQRLFVLSFHSKKQISLLLKNSKDTDVDNQSHIANMRRYGQQIQTKYKQVRLFMLKMGLNPITYFIQSLVPYVVQVQLDCSKSQGYSFIPLIGKIKRKLQPYQSQYIMRLIPNQNQTQQTLIHREQLFVNLNYQ